MTSATLLCPSSIVQPFDQKCGAKEWKSRRRLVQFVTPLPLSTIKTSGFHVQCRHEYIEGRFAGRKYERKFLACRCTVTATVDTDVALEDPIVEPEHPVEAEGSNLEALGVSESAPDTQQKRSRNGNLNAIPSRGFVQNKDLVVGAVFTGKVRSILPFGAFIDFGAFTDGLVHISQLSNTYVNTVQDVVSVGQEVQVRILDVNIDGKRIALTMKDPDNGEQQRRQAGDGRTRRASGQAQSGGEAGSGGRGKTSGSGRARKQEEKKKSVFQKGQTVDGKVKNLIRRGAFVELPGGEEGFLPVSEIPGGERTPLENLLTTGKEVSVRVVKVGGSKIGLSMKPLLDLDSVNKALNQDVEIGGGNAFEIAFRSNPVIGKYLAELEEKSAQAVDKKLDEDQTSTLGDELGEEQGKILAAIEAAPIIKEVTVPLSDESHEREEREIPSTDQEILSYADVRLESTMDKVESDEEGILGKERENLFAPAESSTILETTEAAQGINPLIVENIASVIEAAEVGENIDEATGKAAAVNDVSSETEKIDSAVELSSYRTEAPEVMEDLPSISLMANAVVAEVQADSEGKIDKANDAVTPMVVEPHIADVVAAGSTENGVTVSKSADSEVTCAPKSIEQPLEGTSVTSSMAASSHASEILAVSIAVQQESPADSAGGNAIITTALVKKLREETGSGMMDCKKALIESDGNLDKARGYLRKKGLASAEKKVGRIAAEGAIGSYVHDSRIGVLMEVNCETDFVSRGEIFARLVEDLAMQVVASPQVQYVSVEDVPPEVKNKELEIELQREDLQNKPEQIRTKIVEGRVNKRLGELALLEQPFIKDDGILVKDVVKQTVASIGENIKVRRFVRFTLGEGLEKKIQDFAAEVAAQTSKTEVTESVQGTITEQPATNSSAATAIANVSIAAVKQLREESGAGMMDCKKALVATNGDIEGAREYLRKKGLASADKKASRIAAEGAIGSYIHDSRIGVLVEVNCETDFVSRGELFKQLVEDIAMQVAANPQVDYVSVEDIPSEIQVKERELELEREDLQTKPESVRAKIVDGRLAKRFGELALLEQSFIKDDNILVKDLLKQTVASLGENIRIRRFSRFTLGEGLEKKNENFAAELAAQTSGHGAD